MPATPLKHVWSETSKEDKSTLISEIDALGTQVGIVEARKFGFYLGDGAGHRRRGHGCVSSSIERHRAHARYVVDGNDAIGLLAS